MGVFNELRKTLSAEVGEVRTGYCPECCHETQQECVDLDPDKPGHVLIWECLECNEQVEIERGPLHE